MAREFSRAHRVADQLKRELAQLVQQDVRDPRLGLVTVNEVKVSRDLAYADVYVTVMGKNEDGEAVKESIRILTQAAGFLRGQIAQRIKLRIVPHLRFHYDASVVQGNYLSALIDKAVSQDQQRHEDEEGR
jgi:ribosome-binding factor A